MILIKIGKIIRDFQFLIDKHLFLGDDDWKDAEKDPVFIIFFRSCLFLGVIIVAITIYVDIWKSGLNKIELLFTVPFLIGALGIIFFYNFIRRFVPIIISISFLMLNFGYIFINTFATLEDPFGLNSLTIIASILYYGINSVFFKKLGAQVLNFTIYLLSCFMVLFYINHAKMLHIDQQSVVNIIDMWLLSSGILATQYFSNYIREKNFLRLDEAYRKLDELESHRDLLNENARIRDELTRLSRISVVEAMATSISHETNQPIGSALTFAEAAKRWLARTPPDFVEAMRAIEGVITQIGRAGEIIGSIRRMTARNVEKARDTRAAELFESLMPLLHIYTKNHDIRLTLDLSEIPDSTNIQVRENEIWHVIINLVQNSIEAFNENQESKTIEISAFIDEFCWINICVQDNGPGMNSENLAMVFESFFTTKNGGTGLGLPICREIAELHGGSLIVDSEVGIGTTVTLRLPLSLVDAPGTDHLA